MLTRIFLCFLAVLPALAQTITRYEQDDPRIGYSGVWYPNTNPLESGGSALLANLKGSRVVVLFNGTGITWIGASDYYAGICYLTIDGVPATVNTANPAAATIYQRTLHRIRGLAPGPHRLTIEVIHSHDAATNASWIWVDAFEIENGSLLAGPLRAGAGIAQQTDVAADYFGLWFQQAGNQYSGGSVNLAVDTGARTDFAFNGTSISWIGYRDEWSGLAQVSLDGGPPVTVDTYLSPAKPQTSAYFLNGLSPGNHVLSIVATGAHSPQSAGSWIWVDGFEVSGSAPVTPPPVSPPPVSSPSIGAAGIVDAASFVPVVSPGQIISIFGKNFLSSGSALATGFPLPAQLGPQNTSVTACGRILPLFNLFPGQINAQLPMECATAGPITATVTVGGQSTTQGFTIAPASPGIFTKNASGSGDGIILHADNTLVDAARPARGGETIVIYATGLGATTPAFATGSVTSQSNTTVMPVTLTIGGRPATVTYRGLAQGWVGLDQINAIVPTGLSGSEQVMITVNNLYSSRSGVTIPVQN